MGSYLAPMDCELTRLEKGLQKVDTAMLLWITPSTSCQDWFTLINYGFTL